jgi:hypothetical protein
MPDRQPEHTVYGTDVLCHVGGGVWDLDPTFALRCGDSVLVEHLARALQTTPGSMADEPERGVDLSALESARAAAGAARTVQARVYQELRQDERVDTLAVSVTIEVDAWTVDVRGEGAAGPFAEVFALDAGNVQILTSEAGGG